MKNICLKLSYSGKNYHGWQIQRNALTVQEVFQNALKKVLHESDVEIKGCSRTDAGVHANEYFVSFKTNSPVSLEKVPFALNYFLPKDISAKEALEVPIDFHARYSCVSKEYIYKIWNNKVRNPFLDGYVFHYWYKLDINYLNECTRYFVGKHDFTSFCTLDKRDRKSLVRTVEDFKVFREEDFLIFKVKADGFLYNMVRIMVGTLLKFNKSKENPQKIRDIILARDRSLAGPTAVPQGLYLNRVFYKGINC